MLSKKISFQDLDKVIHEPARLVISGILGEFEEVDFNFLVRATGLSNGNLAAHLRKMEEAGYVGVKKEFKDRKPHSVYSFTPLGRSRHQSHIRNLKKLIG